MKNQICFFFGSRRIRYVSIWNDRMRYTLMEYDTVEYVLNILKLFKSWL